jgi:hypothetical protein
VIVVAVMPGADAVRAALELLLALALVLEPGLELPPWAAVEVELGLELELEQAATASAATVTTAMAGRRSGCDLFIEHLLSHWVPA